MYRFISYKSSAVLSKYSCSRNRYFGLPQNGNYGIERFLQETKTKHNDVRQYGKKYDNFNNDLFREELNNELLNVDVNNAELSEFTETFMSLLEKYAPKKQKYTQANNANFMTKNLRRAIMLRSKFRNRFLKEKLISKETFV